MQYNMDVRVLLVLTASRFWISAGQNTSCSGSQDVCLQALRDYLTRTDWWFGDAYSSTCPDRERHNKFACINPDIEHKTIISRILQTSDFDVRNITQYLHIRFYVPACTYLACGHVFNVPNVYMDEDIDFTEAIYIDSWALQTRPAVTWDPELGTTYTLVVYDVDHLLLAGVWVNIKGGDSSLGYEVYPYRGPLATLNRSSFHAFVLFRQRDFISENQLDTIRRSFTEVIRDAPQYKLNNLAVLLGQALDLMGVGLITLGPDPYSIEKFKLRAMHNSCPWLIGRMRSILKRVLDVHNLSALGADISDLEVEVEVTYTSSALQYTACCKNPTESARTIKLDALSQYSINPVYLRSQPLVKFGAVEMFDQMILLDNLYTVLLLDVTWATTGSPSPQTLLLWHVTDIPGLYVTFGQTQKEYTMPLPLPDRNSLYIFFVFRQNATIGNNTTNYCSTTSSMKDNECDFNLFRYIQVNQLHLSGVNWFWSRADLYSRMKMYEADPTKMDAACMGISGYGQPCPNKCTSSPPTMATETTTLVKVTSRQNGSIPRMSSVDSCTMCMIQFCAFMLVVKTSGYMWIS